MLVGKKVVITGGTGSLGKVLLHRLLTHEIASPLLEGDYVSLTREYSSEHDILSRKGVYTLLTRQKLLVNNT